MIKWVLIALSVLVAFVTKAKMGRDYDPGSNSLVDNWWIILIIVVIVFFVRANRQDKKNQRISDGRSKSSGHNTGKFYRFLLLYQDVWLWIDAYGNSPQDAYKKKEITDGTDYLRKGDIVMVKEFFDSKEKFRHRVERLGSHKNNYGFLIDFYKNGWIPIKNSQQMNMEQPKIALEQGIELKR